MQIEDSEKPACQSPDSRPMHKALFTEKVTRCVRNNTSQALGRDSLCYSKDEASMTEIEGFYSNDG